MIDVFSTMYDRIHTVSLIFALFHSFPYRNKPVNNRFIIGQSEIDMKSPQSH